jgi:cobyrinic acid a,c-diamide synthase
VPVAERAPAAVATVRRLADLCTRALDLDAVLALARSAPALTAAPWAPPRTDRSHRPRIAVAGGAAFTFSYAETVELLDAAGAEVVVVDPLRDPRLPAGTAGLVLGGGFPEVYAAQLSANEALRADVRALARSGAPVHAECAGLLYLCERLDDLPMCGVLPATGRMTERLVLGYRTTADGVRGHEFHRTVVAPRAGDVPAWELEDGPEGFRLDGVVASYLHTHWAGTPGAARAFVDAAARQAVAA